MRLNPTYVEDSAIVLGLIYNTITVWVASTAADRQLAANDYYLLPVSCQESCGKHRSPLLTQE